jgi:shikimate kinase
VSRAPHLVLIGLMGAGKTTVGRACAAELGRGFVDTDELIGIRTGQTIPEIFASVGEAGFRAAERAAITDVVASPEPLVIACGGGAMVDAENRRTVRDEFVVWLTADPAVLAARATAQTDVERPLLAGGDPGVMLRRLADQRAGAYEAAAHATVPTDGRSVAAVTASVLAAYREVDA